MSAFIVTEECIHRCVAALLDERAACEDGDKLGAELFKMNQRAVRARYPRDTSDFADIPKGYRYSPRTPDRFQMLKALECLAVQCGEGDVPTERLYIRVTDRITDLALEIVHALPEYEKAVWG